jgi:hypothetical protein
MLARLFAFKRVGAPRWTDKRASPVNLISNRERAVLSPPVFKYSNRRARKPRFFVKISISDKKRTDQPGMGKRAYAVFKKFASTVTQLLYYLYVTVNTE